MELNVKLHKEEGDLLVDPNLYWKLVGSLIYLTITRPNVSFDVQQVSKFLQTPHHLHLVVVRRIIYLPVDYSFLQAMLLVLLLIVMLIGLVVLIHVTPSPIGACS